MQYAGNEPLLSFSFTIAVVCFHDKNGVAVAAATVVELEEMTIKNTIDES